MSGLSEVVAIEHQTMGERVYRDLREMLVSGQFEPGEKITLRTLAAALGTSAMPVRDALRQLMVENAIELLPNRNFRVPIMSRSRFIEVRDIRIQLEGMAVERAALAIKSAELAGVDRICSAFNAECDLADPDPAKLIVLNKEFHFAVYECARLPVLLQMIEGLWSQIGPVLNFDVRRGSERIRKRTPSDDHRRLVEALEVRDPRKARKALEADLISAGDYILRQNTLLP